MTSIKYEMRLAHSASPSFLDIRHTGKAFDKFNVNVDSSEKYFGVEKLIVIVQ